MPDITTPDYPTLSFFETREWWGYVMPIVVTAALVITAWPTQHNKWAVLLFLTIVPVGLTIPWWPYSTQDTALVEWFSIVRQYSVPAGFLCLIALQYVPRLRYNRWYLLTPPAILTLNTIGAALRDFQCYNIRSIDPTQGMVAWGGPWNIMNSIVGISNILIISGWVGIFVVKGKSKAVVWGDLTLRWIIAYGAWNFAYCYSCLVDRAWHSALALLVTCTIPAFLGSDKGSWIQYHAYTLAFWSAVVLTFPHLMQNFAFVHRSVHNPAVMSLISVPALIVNIGAAIYHLRTIARTCHNPFAQEFYADTPAYAAMIRNRASEEDQDLIAVHMGNTATALGHC